MTRICDYEGSQYRTEFWENANRHYEDLAERIALGRMLPPQGRRLLEVGAGFGRLADMYSGYEQIVLTDYARTQLEQAQDYLNYQPGDDRFIFVVADVYQMPFVDNLFDALVMIRVMHHLLDVPRALTGLSRLLDPDGTAVIEFASKQHLKSIARWLLRQQDWNPFDPTPYEFVDLNLDFHPRWMRQKVRQSGFELRNFRTLSHFRIAWLKQRIPAEWLAFFDGLAQETGNWWQLTPSVFMELSPTKPAPHTAPASGFFKCPRCHHSTFAPPEETPGHLLCQTCEARWEVRDNIYNFKEPLA